MNPMTMTAPNTDGLESEGDFTEVTHHNGDHPPDRYGELPAESLYPPLPQPNSFDALPSALVFTIGPLAATIAEQSEQIHTEWLPLAPTIQHLCVAANGHPEQMWNTLSQQVSTICTAVANIRAATEPWQTTASDEAFPIWLLVDLSVHESNGLAETVVDQRITWALRLLQLLDVTLLRALPTTMRPQLLLLADPRRADDLDRCRRRLVAMAPEPFYMIGAPLQQMGTAVWQQRAATVLATLLCAEPLLLSAYPNPTTVAPQYYTLGATSQPLPTQQIIRALGLLTAHEAVCAILNQQFHPPNAANVPVTTLEQSGLPPTLSSTTSLDTVSLNTVSLNTVVDQLLNNGEEFDKQVPPPQFTRLRRTHPRWWRTATDPIQTLLTYHHIQQNPQQKAARDARHRLLATPLANWNEAWQAFCQRVEESSEQLTDHPSSESPLLEIRQQVITIAQTIDQALAERATTTHQREADVQQEREALAMLCVNLPTLSIEGIWQFVRHPRQWPQ